MIAATNGFVHRTDFLRTRRRPAGWWLAGMLGLLLALSGCGGGGGGGGSSPPVVVAPTQALTASIQLAQTHVLPPDGLTWTLGTNTTTLTLVGNKPALALVKITQSDATSPVLEGRNAAGASLGTLTLAAPGALPPTEAAGPAFASDLWSARVPASWLKPGVSLTARASNYLSSSPVSPKVGLDAAVSVNVLPFYLFGANQTNTFALSATQNVSAQARLELAAKWPVADLNVATHPAGAVFWDRLVINPRTVSGVARPAYAITSIDQQQDGFATLASVLTILGRMHDANGFAATSTHSYGALIPFNQTTGRYSHPGGGLGSLGSGVSVGDHTYEGIFFHEVGHAYDLPHSGEAFNAGNFPYPGGSWKGSVWGYDLERNEFLSPLIPPNAGNFAGCASSRQLDGAGKCFKQDPMQSGAGDQASGYVYAAMPDFSVGRIQRWFEGVTTQNADGSYAYAGGRLIPEAGGTYSRWNGLTRARVAVTGDLTEQGGLYGVNRNLPIQTNVQVYTIVIAYSNAGTPNASLIYPPLRQTGNLIRTFDPTNTTDQAEFRTDTGKYYWYCKGYGCDFTVRVTYADGSVVHRVLKDGFRPWFRPTAAVEPEKRDPNDSDSQITWAINVPGTSTITRIELLSTPSVWLGMPTSPSVLLSRTF